MLSPIKEFVVADDEKQNEENDHDETKNSAGTERSILIDESQPLARCSVLYLGAASPAVNQYGIDSVQEPLSKRYPIDGAEIVRGIEVWLSIDESGLQIQFASDPSVVLYYPIRSLVYCASVRFTGGIETDGKSPDRWRFIPLDSPDAARPESAQNPPVFAVVFNRTRDGQSIDECHCFIAKTKQIAMALVQACSNAYRQTDPEQDCSKVPLYFKILDNGSELKEIDNEITVVPATEGDSTKAAGFFYKTSIVPIHSWQLWENPKHSLRRSSSAKSLNSPHHHRRRLASITSIPDAAKSKQVPTNPITPPPTPLPPPTPTPTPPPPPPKPAVDPYATDPNVLRVERIRDSETGRDIYIRWLKGPPEVVPSSPPSPPLPIYEFQMQSNMIDRLKREVEVGLERLALEYETKKVEKEKEKEKEKDKKKKKKKKKHHRHHKHSQSYHEEYIPTPIMTPIQMSYSPVPFEPRFFQIQTPTPMTSAPFWFYSM